jgi:ElaB/YqjD/DUF883 family membrane-anchored ribosome-binding protein
MATVPLETISEALRVLDEAAREDKEQLARAAAGKFEALRSAITDEKGLKERIAVAAQKAADFAVNLKAASAEKAKEIAGAVDENVHRNPWPYLGGVAVAALLLGFILGRKTSN